DVTSDSNLLQHIFQNLFSNAMKYAAPGQVALCRYHCDDKFLVVTVEDQGIGIPLEDQPRLFELFHRARNVGDVSGTGLGLAIVKRAVDALGGEIEFESAPELGTKFTVRLPL
ncbi:MAG: ATP-binding protein, partial [Chloroflexota bacterium]